MTEPTDLTDGALALISSALGANEMTPENVERLIAHIHRIDRASLRRLTVDFFKALASPELTHIARIEDPKRRFIDVLAHALGFEEGGFHAAEATAALVHLTEAMERSSDPWFNKGHAQIAARQLVTNLASPVTPELEEIVSRYAAAIADEKSVLQFDLAIAVCVGGRPLQEALERHRAWLADAPIALVAFEFWQQRKRPELTKANLSHPPRPKNTAIIDDAEFLKFAHELWGMAVTRIEDVWTAPVSEYRPDGAFKLNECHALHEPLQALVARGDPEFAAEIEAFWLMIVTAPKVTAKTMPSQSIAVLLANATAKQPSVPALLAMASVKGKIRHVGVKKKTERLYKRAVKALAERDDLVLHLDPAQPVPKKLLPAVRRSLEALWLSERVFTPAEWAWRFGRIPELQDMVSALVWRITLPYGGFLAVLSREALDGLSWELLDREPCAAPEGSLISLWHPATACEVERNSWRDRIERDEIAQPIPQVYREWYVPDEAALKLDRFDGFEGDDLSIKQLLGVASARGWLLENGSLRRRALAFDFTFISQGLYPQSHGETYSDGVRVNWAEPNSLSEKPTLARVPPIVLSEILRDSVLFLSVGKRAVEAGLSGRPSQEELRRNRIKIAGDDLGSIRHSLIRRLFPGAVSQRILTLTDFAAAIGDIEIDLWNGHTAHNGHSVEVTSHLAPNTTWLPHEDKTLDRILRTISIILDQNL